MQVGGADSDPGLLGQVTHRHLAVAVVRQQALSGVQDDFARLLFCGLSQQTFLKTE